MTIEVIKFGTDGWRAIVGEDYTVANVRRCASALAQLVQEEQVGERGVVVGYDTRFCSDRFAHAVADTLSAAGLPVMLFDRPAPTPACSFSVMNRNQAAGAMITASHNPLEWNGFKVKSSVGGSAEPEYIERLEHALNQPVNTNPAPIPATAGKIQNFNPLEDYLAQLAKLPDISSIKRTPRKVVVDSMHGAGMGIFPAMLADGAVEVIEIRAQVNPAFPDMQQPEPVATNLRPLIKAVQQTDAAIGIAFDGDADRLGVVDENGSYLSTLDVFSILSHHFLARRKWAGGIACTITMSLMVDRICEAFGRKLYRTPVGFKHVGPAMVANDCVLGGEESGGYAIKGHVPERDGILSALFFLEAMAQSGKSPHGLLDELHQMAGKFAFRRDDVVFTPTERDRLVRFIQSAEPTEIAGRRATSVTRMDGAHFNIDDGKAWVMLRMSGTEPLLRIYAEAETTSACAQLIKGIKTLANLVHGE